MFILLVSLLQLLVVTTCTGQDVCKTDTVRLLNGKDQYEGRVELCIAGVWGTVCDDLWDDADASVVCRQLGFSDNGSSAVGRAYFGVGEGPVFLSDMKCFGTETSLLQCPFGSFVNEHDCSHIEDAGVICLPIGFSCEDGEVRLAEASGAENAGVVEVCFDNRFGTICDGGYWDAGESSVVCRQLGFNAESVPLPLALSGGAYGSGFGPIYLKGMLCDGNETNLVQCQSSNGIDGYTCSHLDDGAVICPPKGEPNCSHGDVRLSNGRIESEGRVEVCYNGVWATICHFGWNYYDASVICGQLGYTREGALPLGYSDFGSGSGAILMTGVTCFGTEESILDCLNDGLGRVPPSCNHGTDVGVVCADPNVTCTDGDVRLAGGDSSNEGRVEVCLGNHWGTVCDDQFGSEEARVVCQQLGYTTEGSIALGDAFFGEGVGVIYFDDLDCIGTEMSLENCSHSGIAYTNCFHDEDASVLCQDPNLNCTNGDLRLANGGDYYGRVEVCFGGRWGTVCDDGWDSDDAAVVCSQLGFKTKGAIGLKGSFYGDGTGPIFLDEIDCSPEKDNVLAECFSDDIGSHDCNHQEDASVLCQIQDRDCVNGDVRLLDGASDLEGRVEVCFDGVWGSICDNKWSSSDASVVCKQLGFSPADAVALKGSIYGKASGPIVVDYFRCNGNEEQLMDCSHKPPQPYQCSNENLASILCRPPSELCEDGNVRLVGGDIPNEGRVEVCIDHQYGTVCDDFWDSSDAVVVCNQLNFTGNRSDVIPLKNAFFGEGTLPIVMSDLFCIGNETSLLDCDYYPNPYFCDHDEDASVLCPGTNSTCTNEELRLVDGNSEYEGRVEACFGGRWGTICDDRWDTLDAQVICGELGYARLGAIAAERAYFDEGDGHIFLDEVACSGTEMNILQCLSTDAGLHNCYHDEDAGVVCPAPPSASATFACESGDVRLADGPVVGQGRVEVCINGVWGTVCSNSWDENEAIVVCKQLGFYDGRKPIPLIATEFGSGSGPVYFSDLECVGNETSLFNCRARGLGNLCDHSEDAGVMCKDERPACSKDEVVLVGGQAPNEGRVEVCRDGWFGTVCDYNWDNNDAMVVCRQLGYPATGAVALPQSFFGGGNVDIIWSDVSCNGNEKLLIDCDHSMYTVYCSHLRDASVLCPNASAVCSNGALRLMGGTSVYTGRVEVCFNGHWGTVCEDSWDNRDAQVVCRQLGQAGDTAKGAVGTVNAYFGQGSGPVFLDEVQCNGQESFILDCLSQDAGIHDCTHDMDAGVVCTAPQPDGSCTSGQIRLVGGPLPNEGRVELCINGVWGTVCDDFWDHADAAVVCHQLGFSHDNAQALLRAHYGEGSGEIYLANVECLGNESSLLECSSIGLGWFCTHDEDASVYCEAPPCFSGNIRLLGGTTPNEGRVEICRDGKYGTICDESWDSNDAAVVCRQLGFTATGAIGISGGYYPPGEGAFTYSDMECTGNEERLVDCELDESGFTCDHSQDAGVICPVDSAECNNGDVRLAGVYMNFEGRIEICFNGRWGTVCDDSWDNKDANVVCRQLNFDAVNGAALGLHGSFFGGGQGPILLDEVECDGDESHILECNFADPGKHDCTHANDAAVVCPVAGQFCTNGDVRLKGGADSTQGRVEVCIGGIWGTICDNGWDDFDASVVCQQLDLPSLRAVAVKDGAFGPGTGPVYMSQMNCFGNEMSIVECSHSQFGNNFCSHAQDAGVICVADNYTCPNGDVRLVDGVTPNEGRVEVCVSSEYGTVCDDLWDARDAAVVCRQLGYQTEGALGVSKAFFGQGLGRVLLDNVRCIGNESNLLSCPQAIKPACPHSQDAGVICPVSEPVCETGDIQLLGSATGIEGRVEVCYGGQWGSICDTLWDTKDATVVCKQLGFSSEGAIATDAALFGRSKGPIFLSMVHCVGNESLLIDCQSSAIGTHDCTHQQDAGVRCKKIPCDDGDIQLMKGISEYNGRVEVCISGDYYTICDSHWTSADASVTCKQLGYDSKDAVGVTDGFFGQGTVDQYSGSYECSGSEVSLNSCPKGTGDSRCSHSNDAGVFCQARGAICIDGTVRLVGGASDAEGRVEVCIGGKWGSVCDDSWDDMAASVVCRQLGYSTASAQTEPFSSQYGTGEGPILLDDVKCTGDEANLLQCNKSPLAAGTDCDHTEDVAITCQESDVTSSSHINPLLIVIPLVVMVILIVVIATLAIILIVLYIRYKKSKNTYSIATEPDSRSDVIPLEDKTATL